MRVLLVVDSSTGYLGAIDVDQRGGSSGFAAKWMAKWLECIGYARMKLQSDTEQLIERLLKAFKSVCTADLLVQRALVKSHASQCKIERAVRLVERISTEPCFSMCRKEQELRLALFLKHQHGY